MTRVNSLVLAYNCTAPACAAPQTPYNLAQQQARFLEWQARTWAGLEQVMTRVNSLVLAYNCTAPACAAPQTPYNLAHQHARFLERFKWEG